MKRNAKKFTLKTSAVLSLALVGALSVTSGANASGVPVIDGVHMGISKFAWIEQYRQKYDELRKQIQQYQAQLRDIENKFVKGQSYDGVIGYREKLAERDANAFVTERCGKGLGLQLGPSQLREIVAAQYLNCVNIVQTENRKYNAIARFLDTLEERDRKLQELKSASNNVDPEKSGELQKASANLDLHGKDRDSDEQAAEALMKGYDQILSALNAEQVWLAKAAFSAQDRGIVGDFVQYGALKGALHIARRRDR